LNELYEEYGDRAEFFVIYIREAHASDSWQSAKNVEEDVVVASPADIFGRADVAQTCVRKLGIRIPALLDDFDDSTEEAYLGWPDRFYVIGRDGRVAFKGNPGPFGFDPELLKAALISAVES
jgi:type I thyroxine 5'-deiodinase